jgi:hypothetical protein
MRGVLVTMGRRPAAVVLGLLLTCACGGPATAADAGARTAGARAVAWAVAATPRAASPRSWWHPTSAGPNEGPEFQWELDHPLDLRRASDTGSGAVNSQGRRSGATTLYDIDGIINPAPTVAALHKLKDRAICYIEIGAAGNYYSAGAEHVRVTYYQQLTQAHDLGAVVPGYPERYLNVNAASTVAIIKAMIRQQCAAKGFDAVEPDIDDSYTDATGFTITEADNVRYDKALGAYAHSLGLAWGQKNGDSDPGFSRALEPATDFLLDEECEYYQTCGIVAAPYTRARKLVLDAEYTQDWGPQVAADLRRFCPADIAGHLDGTLLTTALAGQRNPCR